MIPLWCDLTLAVFHSKTRGVCSVRRTGTGRPTGLGVHWLYMFIGTGMYTGTGTGTIMTLGKEMSLERENKKNLKSED